MNNQKRSTSSESIRPVIPKLLPINTLSNFTLNRTFQSQNTQRNNKKLETSIMPSHKRVLSSSSHISKAKTPMSFTNFKEKSTIAATSINFYSRGPSGRTEKSRPLSSLLGSFHADKTQQDFLKNQNDPIFKDFNKLIQKSKGINASNPFDDILNRFRQTGQKKQREMIFYLRKMNYSKVLMKDLVNELKKYDSCQNLEEREIYLNHIRENWGGSLQVFRTISNILQNLMNNAYDRDMVNKNLGLIIVESQNLRVYQLNLLCILFFAKCCVITKDYFRAISLFKQAKFIAHNYSNMKIKLKCYKGLGTCCQILKKYNLAKHYFIKVLQLSWLVKDKQNELLAYDSIGLQFYYSGDVEQAQYFHFKMMKGEYETEKSSIRALGISKLGITKEKKNNNNKNKQQLRKESTSSEIPENPLLYISSSEEEFELVIPQDQVIKKSSNEYMLQNSGEYSKANEFRLNPNNSNFMKDILMKQANNNIRYKTMMEYELNKMKKLDKMKTQKHMVSAKFLQNNPSINSKIVLSHLTPNKSVNFFHNSIFKGNQQLMDDDNSTQIYNKLDGRSMSKIVKKAKYFNANIFFTIKNVETILNCVGLPIE